MQLIFHIQIKEDKFQCVYRHLDGNKFSSPTNRGKIVCVFTYKSACFLIPLLLSNCLI